MTLSVVIVTHASRDDIVPCLRSIASAAARRDVEVILVDAGSGDDTVRVAIAASRLPLRVVRLRNVGFAAAANAGARLARGEILFFLNPDARVPADAFSRLHVIFHFPRTTVVGGFLRDAREEPERWQAVPFPNLFRVALHHLPARGGAVRASDRPFSVPWVSGGALAVRRDAFRELGGFRERFFLYFEDVDFCRRVRAVGGWVLLDPGLTISHGRGRSATTARRRRAYDRSQLRYFFLHRSRAETIVLWILRSLYRVRGVILLLGAVGAVAALAASFGRDAAGVLALGAILVVLVTARWPAAGVGLVAGTLVLGQSVRVPLGAAGATVTDLALPAVLLGLLGAGLRMRRARRVFRALASGWWIAAALLPGILLAAERLPPAEVFVTLSYAARLGAVLLLIPLLRGVGVPFSTARSALLGAAVLLALAGFVQLRVLPVLSPAADTAAADFFLGRAGGGWDPHERRLFATWLDPNFLGGFFALALSLLLGERVGRGRIRGVWALPLGALLILALVLTQSRASALAFLAALLVFGVVGRKRRLLVPAVTALAAAFLLVPALPSRIFVSPVDDPTVQLRLRSWEQAVGHLQARPAFGAGYNAYGVEQRAVGNVTDPALHSRAGVDNGILMALATTGLWGAFLLGGGVVWALRGLLRMTRDAVAGSLATLLAFVALLVHTQFLQSITYIHLLVPLALLFGSLPSSGRRAGLPRDA